MSSRKILVVGPAWVGDMVMAQSLFMLLRQQHHDVLIHVLAPSWSQPLLTRMPEVATAIEAPFPHGVLGLSQRRALGIRLRDRNYDQAILLPNSFKSALTPWWAKIPVRTGWLGEMRYGLLNDWRPLDKSRLTMTVQRFCALAYLKSHQEIPETPAPALVVDRDNALEAAVSLELKTANGPILALCPGAEYGRAKQWPARHYAQLASYYGEKGWQIWLFGSEKDRAVCQEIGDLASAQCQNLAGKTSLAQAIDLLSLADAVVSNDSGLMHIAAALDRPLVALYGSSDPAFTPPLSPKAQALSLGLACSPCFKRECPLGHLDCLNQITPDAVAERLESLLA